jgi:hypothetical protein
LVVEFVKPTAGHISDLSAHLRPADLEECLAAGFSDAYDAVSRSVGVSVDCWACVIDGKVMGIFGVTVDSLLERRGVLWLLTSHLVDERPKTFVRLAGRALAAIRRSWPSLSVGVDAHYDAALRFALRSGFSSGPTYAHPDTGEPFRLMVSGG